MSVTTYRGGRCAIAGKTKPTQHAKIAARRCSLPRSSQSLPAEFITRIVMQNQSKPLEAIGAIFRCGFNR